MCRFCPWQLGPGALVQSVRQLNIPARSGQKKVETYYDILRVSKDCDSKDIRSAFVHLSKKFHPDAKGSKGCPEQTAKFVKISEAYHTLRKPDLRNDYDQRLWSITEDFITNSNNPRWAGMHTSNMNRAWEIHPNFDPSSKPHPFYGFEGLERVSNSKIALLLLALTVFGTVLGFASVRYSFTFNRQQLDQKSIEASNHLAAVQSIAENIGNEEQLRRLQSRMLNLDV